MKLLNTIKPVERAFTVMDIAGVATVNELPQPVSTMRTASQPEVATIQQSPTVDL